MDDDWFALYGRAPRPAVTQIRRQASGSSSEPPASSQPQPSTPAPPSTPPTPPTPPTSRTVPTTSGGGSLSVPQTSAPPPVTRPTTTAQPPPAVTTRSVSTGTDGAVITLTLTQTPTLPPEPTSPPKGFFQNKAAMGATFGVAGLAAIVLIFALITTCIRRRRAKRFDRDVAEAAAAAAREAELADPYIEEEEARLAGGNWKGPASQGYGKIEDSYDYAPAAMAGAGAYGRQHQYPQHRQGGGDVYNMQDLGAGPNSMYSGSNTAYSNSHGGGGGGAAYYMNDPNEYARAPSVASNATAGYAGVGSGVPHNTAPYAAATGGYDNNHLRYRGMQGPGATAEDAYGGYAPAGDMDRYPNPYATSAYTSPPQAPPVPPKPHSPGPQSRSMAPPSSYNARPPAEGINASPQYPVARESQSSTYDQSHQARVLKVANE